MQPKSTFSRPSPFTSLKTSTPPPFTLSGSHCQHLLHWPALPVTLRPPHTRHKAKQTSPSSPKVPAPKTIFLET